MDFDIKDLKSWSNRHDVKVGDRGYFCERIQWLQNDKNIKLSTIGYIDDDASYAFVSSKSNIGYGFFLPLKAVKNIKEDSLNEKIYRPCKSIEELAKLLKITPKSDFIGPKDLVGTVIEVRDKTTKAVSTTMIMQIKEYNNGHCDILINLDRILYSLKDLFDLYDIKIDDKYQPFGIEDDKS